MLLTIHQTTRYSFETPVQYGLQQLRVTPKTSYSQKVWQWSTRIEGGRKEVSFEDHHRNTTDLISFAPETHELAVISEGEVDIQDTGGILGAHTGRAPLWLYEKQTRRTEAGPGVRALVKGVARDRTVQRLHELSDRIRGTVAYSLGSSRPDWSAEDAVEAGTGVCQDHTHVFLSCARLLGFPARYVSGYLMLNDTTTQEAMHAWAEAHVDGLGWVGFDVSNGISPDTRYVRVATGLDYAEAAPVSGTRIGGASEELDVRIEVVQQ